VNLADGLHMVWPCGFYGQYSRKMLVAEQNILPWNTGPFIAGRSRALCCLHPSIAGMEQPRNAEAGGR
jgi:hypothetical protein